MDCTYIPYIYYEIKDYMNLFYVGKMVLMLHILFYTSHILGVDIIFFFSSVRLDDDIYQDFISSFKDFKVSRRVL